MTLLGNFVRTSGQEKEKRVEYLSFAQTNDNVEGREQLLQRTDERASQASLLVQDNLNHRVRSIKAEQATDMKDVTHHVRREAL